MRIPQVAVAGLVVLVCHASLFAAQNRAGIETADHPWTIDATFRIGSEFGTLRTKDEQFYQDVGLGVKLADGSRENIDLGVTSIGWDGQLFKRINEDWMIGVGAGWLSANSSANNISNAESESFLTRNTFTAQFRWTPLRLETGTGTIASFEIEPALGWASGTVNRYGLVAANLNDTATPNFREFVQTANTSLKVGGPHFELKAAVRANSEAGVRYGLGLGFSYTQSTADRDPLAAWTWKGASYPSELSSYTVFMQFTAGYGG